VLNHQRRMYWLGVLSRRYYSSHVMLLYPAPSVFALPFLSPHSLEIRLEGTRTYTTSMIWLGISSYRIPHSRISPITSQFTRIHSPRLQLQEITLIRRIPQMTMSPPLIHCQVRDCSEGDDGFIRVVGVVDGIGGLIWVVVAKHAFIP
jgi:hypothetical protein